MRLYSPQACPQSSTEQQKRQLRYEASLRLSSTLAGSRSQPAALTRRGTVTTVSLAFTTRQVRGTSEL